MSRGRLMHFQLTKDSNAEQILSQIHAFSHAATDDENTATEIVTIASELMYNTIKYSPQGSLELITNQQSVTLLAEDIGQGFADRYQQVFIEGYSTGGSLGLGLPCILRLSDNLFITTSESGTQIKCVKKLK